MRKLFGISLFFNVVFIILVVFALLKIGSPRYLFELVQHHGSGIINVKKSRTSHLKTLPKSADCIVMLGNSITAECEWRELLENDSIVNRGVIGDGTADILARLDDVISVHPRKIFLLIGVNDLLFLPLSKISENYEKIVSTIRRDTPKTDLYLESVLPIHNTLRQNSLKNEDIEVLNQNIFKLSKKYDATYINLHSRFKNKEESLQENLSIDGIHLNGDGYLLMKEILLPFVNN